MFRRIKNIWKISSDKVVADLVEKNSVEPEIIGDGNAEFLGEGTTEEFEEMEKEKKGFKGLFGL